MNNTQVHIYDLREFSLLGYGWEGKELVRVFEETCSFDRNEEAEWLAGMSEQLQSFRDRNSADVVLLIPNWVTLFKLVKIPSVRSSAVVIRHEVQLAFPHAEEALVWNAVPVVSDAIEQWYLVAAIRRQVFDAMNEATFPSKALLIPRFSLEVTAALAHFKAQSSDHLTHLVNLDLDMGVHLAIAAKQVAVRTLRWSLPMSEHHSAGSGFHDALMSEVRRSKSFMKRQLPHAEGQSLCISGSLSVGAEICQALATEFTSNTDGGVKTLPLDSAVLTCASLAFRKQQCDAIRIAPWVVSDRSRAQEKPLSFGGRALFYAACIAAMTPFPWVLSHHLALGHLGERLRHYQGQYRSRNAAEEQWMQQGRELKRLVVELAPFQWIEGIQSGWQDLLSHLQNSLIEAQDLWLDDCELSLPNAETPHAILTFSGRFLLRQRNLEPQLRPQVIRDTEDRLKRLQRKLLASPLVAETLDFNVNYEGIEAGINVVMFSMKLQLKEPLSMKPEGGHDG